MKSRTTVLFVEHCSDLKGGGAQRVFLNILRSLNSERFEIFAAFPEDRSTELSSEVPEHIATLSYDSKTPTPNKSRLLSYLLFALFIPTTVFRWCYLVKKHSIKIVYVHSIISGLHFSLVSRITGTKLIYHEHNMASQRPTRALWRWLFSFVTREANRVVAISQDVADDLIKFKVAQDKIEIIHNGIEPIEAHGWTAVGRKRLNAELTTEVIVVGMVGHFRPWKGQHLFVDSLNTLIHKRHNVHYVIVGGIHDASYYDEVVQFVSSNNLGDHITIMGHQENVHELIACFDIVVVPSIPEPFGLVVLEAMMMNKPVVAFDIGGPREIIVNRSTGLLVKPDDRESLARAIVKLSVDTEARMEMGKRGRERVMKEFTSQTQAARVTHLIDQLH